MRNLELLIQRFSQLPTLTGDNVPVALDSGGNCAFIIASGSLFKVDLDSRTFSNICRLPLNESNGECQNWLSCYFIVESETILCISKEGELLVVQNDNFRSESVGMIEEGISCSSISSDESTLYIVTNVGVLVSLSVQSWQLLSEITDSVLDTNFPVSIACKSDSSFVSVSGVDLRDNIRRIRVFTKELVPHSLCRNEDESTAINLQPCLNWSNGELLTSTSVSSSNDIVFFEKNGLRHGSFQIQTDTFTCVTHIQWNLDNDLLLVCFRRPSSIDSSQQDVIHLYHRSNYDWQLKSERIIPSNHTLAWIGFDPEKTYRIVFITRSVLNDSSSLIWEWEVYWAVCLDNNDVKCSTFVASGSNLKLTSLGVRVVPPPMCDMTISISDASISSCVSFCGPYVTTYSNQNGTRGMVCGCISSCGELVLIHGTDEKDDTPKIVKRINLLPFLRQQGHDDSFTMMSIRQLVLSVTSSDSSCVHLSLAVISSCLNSDELVVFNTDVVIGNNEPESKLSDCVYDIGRYQLDGIASRLISCESNECQLAIQLCNGDIITIAVQDGSLVPMDTRLPEVCPRIKLIGSGSNIRVVGLSRRNILYLDEKLISLQVSTFDVNHAFQMLIYVTIASQTQVKFISFHVLRDFDLIELDELENSHDQPRNVERGSRLVCAVPSLLNPNVVIQLPRGNLECFSPRALVLHSIRSFIDSRDYKSAFYQVRRQHIDMNILVDHNPTNFLCDDGERFISHIDSDDYLNTFLSNLSNDDCTLTSIPCPLWYPRSESVTPVDNLEKINRICCAIRRSLLKLYHANNPGDSSRYLFPIITTYAKSSPPDLESALLIIRDNAVMKGVGLMSQHVQDCIKYLSYLSNIDDVYNCALGMYDFDLVVSVARQSQKDPREYMAYLDRLTALPLSLRKFEIDNSLKRFGKAAIDLLEAGPEHNEKCFKIMEQHDLQPLVHNFLRSKEQSDETRAALRLVVVSIGRSHMRRKDYRKALVSLLSVTPPDFDGVVEACMASGNWEIALTLATEPIRSSFNSSDVIGPSNEQRKRLKELAIRFSESMQLDVELSDRHDCYAYEMKERKKLQAISNASSILLDYCLDVDEAVSCLMCGKLWVKALRICRLHNRIDIEDGVIKPAVLSFSKSRISSFPQQLILLRERFQELEGMWEERKGIFISQKILDSSGCLLEELEGDTTEESASQYSWASRATDISSVSKTSQTSQKSRLSLMDESRQSVVDMPLKSRPTTTFSISGNPASQHVNSNRIAAKHYKGLAPFQVDQKERRSGREKHKRTTQNKGIVSRELDALSHIRELISTCVDAQHIVDCIDCLLLLHENDTSAELELSFSAYLDGLALFQPSITKNTFIDRMPSIPPQYLQAYENPSLLLYDIDETVEYFRPCLGGMAFL